MYTVDINPKDGTVKEYQEESVKQVKYSQTGVNKTTDARISDQL